MSRYVGDELHDLPTPPQCIDADECNATTCKCIPWRAAQPYTFTLAEREALDAHIARRSPQ